MAHRTAFDLDHVERVAEQRTARGDDLVLAEPARAATRQVLATDPLGHEPRVPCPDVLVGNQGVEGVGRRQELLEQQVGKVDPLAGGEGPETPHAFARDPFSLRHDARVVVAARRGEAPEPGERGRQDMEQAQDAIRRFLAGTGRGPNAEAADVHRHVPLDDAGDDVTRDDDTGIGTRHARGVLDVVPDQRPRLGDRINVQEQERFGRLDGQLLQLRVAAVFGDVVHAHEPRLFGVAEVEFALAPSDGAVAQAHVVGHGEQFAAARQGQVTFLARHQVLTEQQSPVALAVGVLEHLALAAAAGAFVHENHVVVVGGDDLDGRAVGRDPPLVLALVQQHAINALFGARAGVEVVTEQFMRALPAVVDDDLFPPEIGVTKDRRHVNEGAGRKPGGDLLQGQNPLNHRQPQGEEPRVGRTDGQGGEPLGLAARREGEDRQFLLFHPVEGPLAQPGEILTEPVAETLLVGGQLVTDEHALGVAPPHVSLGVVGHDPVTRLADPRFHNASPARYVVGDFLPAVFPVPDGQFDQFPGGTGIDHAGRGMQQFLHLRGQSG